MPSRKTNAFTQELFKSKLGNYAIHDTRSGETRPIEESLIPHLYRLALKEYKSRGGKNFIGCADDSVEKYRGLCQKHKVKEKLKEHEEFRELGELAQPL